MFSLTILIVFRAIFIIWGKLDILLDISILSAVVLAISVPSPIAMPKSDVARTGLSFIPSPINITFPDFFNLFISSTFPSGINLALYSNLNFLEFCLSFCLLLFWSYLTSSISHSLAIFSAFVLLSPVSITTFFIPVSYSLDNVSLNPSLIFSLNVIYATNLLSTAIRIAFSGTAFFCLTFSFESS